MKIEHVTQGTEETWVFKPLTAMEHQAMDKVVVWLKNKFKVDMKEVTYPSSR